MQELKAAREEIEQQMRVAANSQEDIIRAAFINFFDRMKDEYGFYDIAYEIACQWEDPDSGEQLGLEEIVICNN